MSWNAYGIMWHIDWRYCNVVGMGRVCNGPLHQPNSSLCRATENVQQNIALRQYTRLQVLRNTAWSDYCLLMEQVHAYNDHWRMRSE